MPCQSSGEVVANMTFFDRTHVISCQALLAAYTYNLLITLAMINGSMLLSVVKPGGGKEHVTTPVGRNVTLQCSIINAANLVWLINGLVLLYPDSQLSNLTLH